MPSRHFSVSAETAAKLRHVVRNINPKHFDMKNWFNIPKNPKRLPKKIEDLYARLKDTKKCGTVACLAGWVCAIENVPNEKLVKPSYGISKVFQISAEREATAVLGITNEQAEDLFYTHHIWGTGWPVIYGDQYKKAKTPEQKYDVLRRRVEHFIRTGK